MPKVSSSKICSEGSIAPVTRSADGSKLDRRDALSVLAIGGVLVVGGCKSTARSSEPAPALSATRRISMPTPKALEGAHTAVPLPFKAGALNGLSEKLISSHYEKNYGGAVKNLNKVEHELAKITKDSLPFVVTALRDKELAFRNSKTLHEAYFANLGGNGKRAGKIDSALGQAYGAASHWEDHFRATGMGLAGGSGWVILGYELETGALRTVACANHSQAIATAIPLLVMDMYEHSYQMDFGAAAQRYIDAFFVNINWDEVNKRFERASRAAEALRSK
jgi:superoxide dismutase, Fe-Mn family